MNLNNLFMVVRMFLNKDFRKLIFKIQKIYRQDPNFSSINTLRYMLTMIKGEKIVKFGDKYVLTSFLPPIPSKAFFQLALATPDDQDIYTQQMHATRSAPLSFFLALTNKCNYNCKHCSAKGRHVGKELTTKQWKEVIEAIQNIGTAVIGLTGGEPLLKDDLEGIISSIDERSSSILYTNGKGFTYERAKSLKDAGLFAVGISLDTHIKAKFNEFRNNKDAFDNSIEALKNARDAGLYTMLQAFFAKDDVTKENLKQLLMVGKKLKVHEMRILEPITSGRLFDPKKHEAVIFDKATRQKIIDFQLKYNNRRLTYPKITTFAYFESDEKFGCGAGTQHSYITPSGELLPCDFVPLSFGNVLKEDVGKLWLEMNEIIGLPKSGCFANKINKELQLYKDRVFPLERSISENICKKHQATTFPKFFSIWQGKRGRRND